MILIYLVLCRIRFFLFRALSNMGVEDEKISAWTVENNQLLGMIYMHT